MDLLHELTVGQVSGVIAVGTALIAFTTPLLVSVILIKWQGKAASAATWSVIARQLHMSTWPTFLRTDSVAGKHVDHGVSLLAYLSVILSLLTVIAGIVTPLGLHEAIAAAGTRDVSFGYAPDLSSFGRSTQGRPALPPSRDCVITSVQCPGVVVAGNVTFNDDGEPQWSNPNVTATTHIPENITTMFTSATNGTTIASIFDIQYRTWKRTTNEFFDDGKEYLKGSFRAIENLILRENITLVDGVIADFASGGIGYRNHTLPATKEQGSQWKEDILWIEPEFVCVNTNLSFLLTLGSTFGTYLDTALEELNMVDEGGFARLPKGNPYTNFPDITYRNPNPRLRAERTAWLHNFLAAMIFNVTDTKRLNFSTNATEGAHYKLPKNVSFANGLMMRPYTSYLYIDTWVDIPEVYELDNGSLADSSYNATEIYEPREDYPYYYASWLDRDLFLWCNGQGSEASAENAHNVECGYFFGHPQRIDGGSWLEDEAKSSWKIPLYVAAGAVKVSVKTITFASNGTDSLQDMAVIKIEDKLYKSEAEHPLWAVEDWSWPGSEGAYAVPLWGIVADSYEGTKGYNFTRSPHLYLPYSYASLTWDRTEAPLDSLAGPVMPYSIMWQVLTKGFDPGDGVSTGVAGFVSSYSGMSTAALKAKWYELSQTEAGAEKMLRLVWTDIMTSATIGTKGRMDLPILAQITTQDEDGGIFKASSVTVFARRITYDLRFAVPAVLLLALWGLLTLVTAMISIIFRYRPSDLARLLNETSVGRVAARGTYPVGEMYATSSTEAWIREVGHVQIRLGDQPREGGSSGGEYELVERGAPRDENGQMGSNQVLLSGDKS